MLAIQASPTLAPSLLITKTGKEAGVSVASALVGLGRFRTTCNVIAHVQ